jgi:hypothetical protein
MTSTNRRQSCTSSRVNRSNVRSMTAVLIMSGMYVETAVSAGRLWDADEQDKEGPATNGSSVGSRASNSGDPFASGGGRSGRGRLPLGTAKQAPYMRAYEHWGRRMWTEMVNCSGRVMYAEAGAVAGVTSRPVLVPRA